MAIQNFLRLTSTQSNNVIALTQVGTPSAISLEYRTNSNQTWQSYTIGTQLTLSGGSWVEFRNTTGTFSTSASNYYKFTMSRRTQASGNVNSLLDWTQDNPTFNTHCFFNLFRDCSSLLTAPELPAKTLARNCYRGMFYGCTSLTTAPELPAKTLKGNCYMYMFYGCTSLTTAPELPAKTLDDQCYAQMFKGCSRLFSVVFGASTVPASDQRADWLSNVGSTGVFYYTDKNLDVSGFPRDGNGIPAGWSIQYLERKPELVLSINGRAVATLKIDGKEVAKLTHNYFNP